MRALTPLLLALLLPLLVLAGARPARADLEHGKLEHQGRTRTWHLYVPPGHDPSKPAPLVLALHGGGGTGERFDRSTNGSVTREAERRGWLVVFPDGVDKGWNDGREIHTRRDVGRKDVDDVGFLAKLVERLVGSHGVDPARVYAMGISNGGFMSFRLGVDLAEKIAAIAPVTANMTPFLAGRKPARPMPVLVLNGTADPLVPYDGGHVRVLGQDRGAVLSTEASIRWWVERNGCPSTFTRAWLPDRARDGTRVEVVTHADCAAGTEVVLYRIVGGGHTWPGGQQYLPRLLVGRVCRDIDGTRTIFDFFARHRLPEAGSALPAPERER